MGMKKLLGAMIFAAVLGCFTACDTGGGGSGKGGLGGGVEEEIDGGKTRVNFDNTGKVFPVSVYSDSLRTVKLADIAAGGTKRIETLPSMTGTAFYMTYTVTVEGISFPYYDGNSFVMARVDEGRTTRVPVPALERAAFTQVYVKVLNNGDSSLTFRKGSSELMPEGAASTIVMNGETAVYRLEAGAAAGYAFMKNGSSPLSFPDEPSAFEAGHIYTFTFNGAALALAKTTPITLEAAAPPPPPGVTLAWSGGWRRTGEYTYTSNPIEDGQSTIETLTIRTGVPRKVTIELSASSESGHDFGYAALSNYQMSVSGAARKTYTYTVPTGMSQIQFRYSKDESGAAGSDSVTVKVLNITVREEEDRSPPIMYYEHAALIFHGAWLQTGPNIFTSQPILDDTGGRSLFDITHTVGTLEITNAFHPIQITVELSASSESGCDFGYASLLNELIILNDGTVTEFTIQVSGTERKTHTYTVPAGRNVIRFLYKKDGRGAHGDDNVTLKILSVQ
ncbi:MAG: hypothetical protein LBD13_01200 [Spirochaetaceae bacterium]|jgi:hypothetical protein|nr:hypothetical protein [Spirochaetaceae bacterium]